MGQSELLKLNDTLSDYLFENKFNKSFLYAPCVPDLYWSSKIKIAICNLETYCIDRDDYEKYQDIQTINNETLQQWSYGNQTIAKTFYINYCIRKTISGELINIDSEQLRELRRKTKIDDEIGDDMYQRMKESLYFNFRYSISKKPQTDRSYILGTYKNTDFFCNFYRNYINAANLDILLISGTLGVELIKIIYPELQDDFSFKGKPMTVGSTIFVSIPHPSRISYKALSERLYTISNFITQNSKKGE